VADAWGLGVAKVPAVVVDRRYVVYGQPDAARALARIEQYRRTQP
jgi:integrating conjugative element protein (TIGR03757 family)